VPLSDYDPLEQVDLLEAEQRSLVIEFGREVVHVTAATRGDPQASSALIEHLKKLYFIGHEERQKLRAQEDAAELVRLSKLTFRLSKGPGGANVLEVGNK
jgi:hypothetical protein